MLVAATTRKKSNTFNHPTPSLLPTLPTSLLHPLLQFTSSSPPDYLPLPHFNNPNPKKVFSRLSLTPLPKFLPSTTGGFKEEGVGSDVSLPTPAELKRPTFVLIRYIQFWLFDPKKFLKVPLAPKNSNFEGKGCAKKTQFFGQNFSKTA